MFPPDMWFLATSEKLEPDERTSAAKADSAWPIYGTAKAVPFPSRVLPDPSPFRFIRDHQRAVKAS